MSADVRSGGGQRMAPGMHSLRLITGYRTLFRRLYMEDWVCSGCQLRFCFKGRLPEDVNQAVQYLRVTHAGYMGDRLMGERMASLLNGLAAGQLPDVVGPLRASEEELAAEDAVDALPYFFEKPVKLKLDWAGRKLARRGVTWRGGTGVTGSYPKGWPHG